MRKRGICVLDLNNVTKSYGKKIALKGMKKKEAKAQINELLKTVNLAGVADKDNHINPCCQ